MHILRHVFKNFIYLSASELTGKVFSFLTIVYLARTISTGSFGILAFVTAFIAYFVLFIDQGFGVIGVKKISQNKALLNNYVDNVISIKIIYAAILYLVLIVVVLLLEKPLVVKIGLLVFGAEVFVQAFALNFVFQAVEDFKYLSYKILGRNILYFVCVVLFVRNDNEILFVFFLMIASEAVFTAWHLYVYQKRYGKYKFTFDKRYIKALSKETFPLLFSMMMATIYGNMDMVMLGFIKPESEVGIYSAAYKIFLIAILPYNILLQVFLPVLSRFSLTREFRSNLTSFVLYMIILGAVTMLPLFLLSHFIINIVFGDSYSASVMPLQILAANGMIVCLSVAFGNPLTVWGKQKYHAIALTVGGVTNIVLNFCLIPAYSYNGAALATLFSELAVFSALIFIFTKSTKKLYSNRLVENG